VHVISEHDSPSGLLLCRCHTYHTVLHIILLECYTAMGNLAQSLCSTSSNFSPLLTLQDRIASLNGRTVQLVIRQDRPGFIRLIGISVLQSAASAVLAPSLRQVADALAMTWRRRLTTAAHARYFKGNTFYTTSQLAGQPAVL